MKMKLKSETPFGVPNKNGHVWPVEVMKKAIEDYNKKIKENEVSICLYDQINEFNKLNIQDDDIADCVGILKNIRLLEDNTYEIEFDILDTMKGKLLNAFLDEKIKFTSNIRLEAETENKVVKEGAKIMSVCLVYNGEKE